MATPAFRDRKQEPKEWISPSSLLSVAHCSIRFISTFFATVALSMVAVGVFNYAVDPYDMRITAANGGQDVHKPAVGDFAKISKPFAVTALQPDGVILGSSRSYHALDPEHPGWRTEARQIFNFAQFGTTITELRREFEHVISVGRPRLVVLELDFYDFNVHRLHSPDFDDALLRRFAGDWLRPALRRIMLLVSIDTLRASMSTLVADPVAESDYEPDGRTNDRLFERKVVTYKGHHAVFLMSEHTFIDPFFASAPGGRPSYRDVNGPARLEEFNRILALARAHDVDLRCYIGPVHARLLEVYRALGLDAEIESWKRDLVGALDAEASAHPGASAFPLWDFSGYNSITTEAVPPVGDQISRMRWYWESSHYRQETGDLVLNRLFDPQGRAYAAPVDFGVPLTPSTVDTTLAQENQAGATYRATHPGDLAEIMATVARVRANSHP